MTPTLQQKVGALQHVRYEIASLLLTPSHDASNSALAEAVELARMVHSRALYDFFSTAPADRHQDDIVSKDFCLDPEPLYGDDARRKELVDRFNKHLFHLTYSRVSLPKAEKEWPRGVWLPPVEAQAKKFIDHILQRPPFSIPEEQP